jgi:hypothetical protein
MYRHSIWSLREPRKRFQSTFVKFSGPGLADLCIELIMSNTPVYRSQTKLGLDFAPPVVAIQLSREISLHTPQPDLYGLVQDHLQSSTSTVSFRVSASRADYLRRVVWLLSLQLHSSFQQRSCQACRLQPASRESLEEVAALFPRHRSRYKLRTVVVVSLAAIPPDAVGPRIPGELV